MADTLNFAKKALWIFLLLGLTSLGTLGHAEEKNAAADALTAPKADGPMIMKVNGQAVTQGELDKVLNQMIQFQARQMQQMGQDMPTTAVENMRQGLKNKAVDQLIIRTLMDQAMKKHEALVTDAMVKAKLDNLAKEMEKEGVNLQDQLKQAGMSEDELKKQLRQELLAKATVEALTGKLKEPTDADMQKLYDDAKKAGKLDRPEEWRASHILFMFKSPTASPEDKAALKKKAEAILKKAKAGEDFAKLAQENSDDGSAKSGGDLQYFPKGKMVEPFQNAVEKLKPGQISDVVESQYGYHIIKVTGHRDPRTPSFADVKGQIRDSLIEEEITKDRLGIMIAKLRSSAKVVDAEGKPIKLMESADMPAPGKSVPPPAQQPAEKK